MTVSSSGPRPGTPVSSQTQGQQKSTILKDLYTQLRKHVPPEKFSELQQLLRRLKSSAEGVNIQQAVLAEMCNIAGKDLIRKLLIKIKAGKTDPVGISSASQPNTPTQQNIPVVKILPCGCPETQGPACNCGCSPSYDVMCERCGKGLLPSLKFLLACKQYQ